jgi:thiol-disulfide isomerase/thioredoxin
MAAPDAVLTKTDGTSASVIGPRQGGKAILVFWATWCPHCYENLGIINDSLASAEKKGIRIILVDLGETKEDVKNYFNRRQMKLISFIDGDGVLQEPYHLIGIPTLIFIDEKGIVRSVAHAFPLDYENYFSA